MKVKIQGKWETPTPWVKVGSKWEPVISRWVKANGRWEAF